MLVERQKLWPLAGRAVELRIAGRATVATLTKRRGIGGHAAERLPLAAFAPPRPLVGAWDVAKRVDLDNRVVG
jgi:hypothetical protein